jgi:4-hydroxybenzoate polyprenyltransferase
MFVALIKTMRPRQWIKNVFVFAPLIFDVKLFNIRYLAPTTGGFLLLCLISGTVYIINDLADIEEDRNHPEKRHRPLPAGDLNVGVARAAAVVFPLLGIPLGFLLHPVFGGILAGYLMIQIGYSFGLKDLVIIDVLIVASGFLLRVASGVPLVDAERFSPWLYICMTLLALLIGFGKRRHELVLLKECAAGHRHSLQDYNIPFLDHIISILTASTLLAYALYTFSAPNLPSNHAMMLTIPFVLYGIFRYIWLIHVQEMGGAPEEIVLSDHPLQITIVMWGVAVVLALYVLQ